MTAKDNELYLVAIAADEKIDGDVEAHGTMSEILSIDVVEDGVTANFTLIDPS